MLAADGKQVPNYTYLHCFTQTFLNLGSLRRKREKKKHKPITILAATVCLQQSCDINNDVCSFLSNDIFVGGPSILKCNQVKKDTFGPLRIMESYIN